MHNSPKFKRNQNKKNILTNFTEQQKKSNNNRYTETKRAETATENDK